MVTTICYGKEETWKSREEAMREFKECMFNSEGSEHERYEKIYWELEAGYEVASDIEWCFNFKSLLATAQVHCMSEFLNKVVPYDCHECNNGDLHDLIGNIEQFIDIADGQYTIDYEGNWYDEGRKI